MLTLSKDAFFAEFRRIFSENALSEMTEEQIEKFYDLTAIMLEVNEHMNLTAITDEKAVILRHYADSLAVLPYLKLPVQPEKKAAVTPNKSREFSGEKENVAVEDIKERPSFSTTTLSPFRVLDVGCGAGFPSLPLAIACPWLSVTALDSTAKRVRYVEETAAKLGLSNLKTVVARAEEAAHTDMRESYDAVLARAVAPLPVLAEFCLPYVKTNGYFLAMKAAKAGEELAKSAKALAVLGKGVVKQDISFYLHDGEEQDERHILLIQKKATTPKNYPRNYAQISKKPLS